MLRRILLTVISCALLAPAVALAQVATSAESRVGAVGHVGIAQAGSGETIKATGLELGATLSTRPFRGVRGLGVEFGFATVREPRDPSAPSFSDDMTAREFALRGTYHFGRGHWGGRPYVFGGLAIIAVDYESTCVDCVFDIDPVTGRLVSRGTITERIESRKAGYTAGAGVDVRLSRTLFLRTEGSLSDTTPGSGWNWGWGALRLGLGYRF